MSALRLNYFYRKIVARSWAATELDYYTDDVEPFGLSSGGLMFGEWSDTFDRSGTGELGCDWSASGAEWHDGPILYEVTVNTPEGEKLIDLRILP